MKLTNSIDSFIYKKWQRSLWASLLVWWCLGTLALVLLKQTYQFEWALGCFLGGLQAGSLHWVAKQLKNKLQAGLTTDKVFIGKLLVLSFVKVTVVAFCIVAFGGGVALKSLVVMLGFLGYNFCIVVVSAFYFNLGSPKKTLGY
ncbi:MAG: hypothetical protein H2174_08890 [Vampirovibrio sp.]|jgi:hypothetical protein|nr:hypothetical protein [Vampirovibrio sp.]